MGFCSRAVFKEVSPRNNCQRPLESVYYTNRANHPIWLLIKVNILLIKIFLYIGIFFKYSVLESCFLHIMKEIKVPIINPVSIDTKGIPSTTLIHDNMSAINEALAQ